MDINTIINLGNELQLLTSANIQALNNIRFTLPFTEETAVELKDVVYKCPDDYILLFLKLLNNVHMETAVTFLVTFLECLCESSNFATAFATIGARHHGVDPVAPFTSLVTKQNVALLEKSYSVMGSLLGVSDATTQAKPIATLLDACLAHLGRGDPKMLEVAVHTLAQMLRNPAVRLLFTAKEGCAPLIRHILNNSNNVQLIYEIGFCLWMLSYCDKAIVSMLAHNTVALLHDILRNSKKEKCTRIALLTLTNFVRLQQRQHGHAYASEDLPDAPSVDVDAKPLNILGDMVSVGLVRTLQLMSKRSFGDPDILPLVDSLLELLQQNIENTTSFADYKQEVLSGRLEWTPVHKSEKFWKENIKEFENDNYKILRELSSILNTTQDTKTLTIICHDLGEFVKYHPQGRRILNTLEVKTKILALKGPLRRGGQQAGFALHPEDHGPEVGVPWGCLSLVTRHPASWYPFQRALTLHVPPPHKTHIHTRTHIPIHTTTLLAVATPFEHPFFFAAA
eukprot:NODE_185_length_1690_cov_332.080439_g126_i0.p1 GENE.NODE_185_length_1690_cov_332.080439_g126_i0~~NODE_185_length_1690_cov_332.080439_g126_i0.p1  ORF type:complete len:529 (+),score=218.20 NODE_185_length_1690_cov_332.080439_g126_i0:57-1589(+)